ncbi:MAG: hypothetical protein AAGN66_17750 [Acidobacteriota bacterium]
MTTSQKVALLWFLGGVANLFAGLAFDPNRPLAIFAGLLFFLVGFGTLRRGRRMRGTRKL